ncbi:MAG: M55 family metallopeptidase [Candidatus Eremiobacteraeota bacterium]|nr:M55 family metallopeptidase [Candidatus Eremiobacteraeota bacterium]MBC5828132.1 M55 family metallopeptidase [Candidatus Eremiobacteraeota bacterium]
MKLYISADMEGIAGILTEEQTNPARGTDYARACGLMTGEVNAACEGAGSGGATSILVNDSHWNMRNIMHEQLPPAVRLIQGIGKPLSMNQGLEPSFDAAAFIGYHAPIGIRDAVLDHTYSDATIYDVRINGDRCSEARLNAAVAGHFNVPVIFLSGDQNACADARSFLPWARTVAVKEAIGRHAAASLSPMRARAEVRAGMELAVRAFQSGDAKPYGFAKPIHLELTFTSTAKADMAGLFPGTRRVDGRTLTLSDDDYMAVFNAFRAMTALGGCA